MDLCCCEKCNKWFDANDGYDNILIAKKAEESYEILSFCKQCGKQIHDAITDILNDESEASGNETQSQSE